MKTKKALFTLLLFIIAIVSNAQDYKKGIVNDFDKYNALINAKSFEKALEYIAPEFFEIHPKSEFLKLMQVAVNDPSFLPQKTTLYEIADAQKIENKYYSLLTYSIQMRIKVVHKKNKTEDDKEQLITFTKSVYNGMYGPENVLYNKETETFEILAERPGYAVSIDGQKNWKFFFAEKHYMDKLKELLPKQVFDKLTFK